jgi:hypothetical protein
MNRYLKIFCPVVWLGVLINLGLALTAVFAPGWLMSWLHWPAPHSSIWIRAAGLLSVFLSSLYFAAGYDPLRYKANAVVSVVARLTLSLLWLWPVVFAHYPRAFWVIGLVDLVFGLAQGVLLILLLREEDQYARAALVDAGRAAREAHKATA